MEPPTGSISVTVLNETPEPVDTERWAALVQAVLEAEGVTAPAETNVVFVDRATMAELNEQHMGASGPTDVLSFPIDDEAMPLLEGEAMPRLVGDIVLCGAVAEANAPEHAGTLDDEIALLLVHGSLHLLGHDHADAGERADMWAAEQRLLAGLWGPLAQDLGAVVIAVTVERIDVILIVVVLLLIALSAVIAVAETAITRISRSRAAALEEQGRKRAHLVVQIVGNFERSLNAVYFVALAAQTVQAALTGVVANRLFGTWGVVVATLVNVLLVFIIAEAAPKTWALQHTDRAALSTAPIVVLCGRLFRHVADALIVVTNVILPGKGLQQGPFVTEEELIALMGEAAEASVIEEEERDLIESIIDFGDTVAREIMVPRTDMVSFEAAYKVADCVEIAILNGLSRFPVYRDNVDDIVGIVYAKDMMRAERDRRQDDPIEHLMRTPHFVPETKRVAELLREMQTRKTHIAIVVDEYGGTAGLVTMEDLLEELVGDIADEFDLEVPVAEVLESGDLLVHDASINVDDVNDTYELNLPEGDWDSVGGLVFSELGRIPAVGDVVEVEGYQLIVESVDGRRVGALRIIAVEADEVAAAE